MGRGTNGEGVMIADNGFISCSHWGLIPGRRLVATYQHVPVFECDHLDEDIGAQSDYWRDLPWKAGEMIQLRTELPPTAWRRHVGQSNPV